VFFFCLKNPLQWALCIVPLFEKKKSEYKLYKAMD